MNRKNREKYFKKQNKTLNVIKNKKCKIIIIKTKIFL